MTLKELLNNNKNKNIFLISPEGITEITPNDTNDILNGNTYVYGKLQGINYNHKFNISHYFNYKATIMTENDESIRAII